MELNEIFKERRPEVFCREAAKLLRLGFDVMARGYDFTSNLFQKQIRISEKNYVVSFVYTGDQWTLRISDSDRLYREQGTNAERMLEEGLAKIKEEAK